MFNESQRETLHELGAFVIVLVLLGMAGWEHANGRQLGSIESGILTLAGQRFLERARKITDRIPRKSTT